ncbi:MAG: hypothetical protein D6694_03665 [Gammaproteobacteria bacterium]|nr:MAG: hypothetical protein D6694_03665 [Gammaproteobacteria bacterium]
MTLRYRLKLELTPEEYDRLLDQAIDELRSLPDQAHLLIRIGLGLYPPKDQGTNTQQEADT